jgi:cytochrome c-type biogenesis protein CcmH/NrfG
MVGLAWILATHPDVEVRDEELAVDLAERAQALTGGGEVRVLDALAAAYASAGRFDEAVEVATAMIDLLQANGRRVPPEIRGRLESYQRESPYREP